MHSFLRHTLNIRLLAMIFLLWFYWIICCLCQSKLWGWY